MQSSTKATTSMILGIISLVSIFTGSFAVIGIVLGIIGLVFGIQAKKELNGGEGTGMATAGIVCSIIGLSLCLLTVIACAACLATFWSFAY